MAFMVINSKIVDLDFRFLKDFLALLDSKIDEIEKRIKLSSCPDSDGLFDEGEYYTGLGFSAIQQYLACAYPQKNINKNTALNFGRKINEKTSVINIINATANYWKHQEEWGIKNIVEKDLLALEPNARRTIQLIQEVTPWDDYTCSNVVASLTQSNSFKLTPLIPIIEEWLNEMAALKSSKNIT